MADFAAAHTEFGATKTMRSSRDLLPGLHRVIDSLSPARHRHRSLLANRVVLHRIVAWMHDHIVKLRETEKAEENLSATFLERSEERRVGKERSSECG